MALQIVNQLRNKSKKFLANLTFASALISFSFPFYPLSACSVANFVENVLKRRCHLAEGPIDELLTTQAHNGIII